MMAASMAEGEAAVEAPCPSGGEVFNAAVRCSQSFCCVRDGGSAPGGRDGGDARDFLDPEVRFGEGGVWG